MANNKQAYILTDRGTYLARVDELELTVVFEGDPVLINPYAIIAVNPEKHPHVNRPARTPHRVDDVFAGQTLIEEYRINGKQLFHLFE